MHLQYAQLIANYCFQLKSGDKLLIRSTYLAEPFLAALYTEFLKQGVLVEFDCAFKDQERLFYESASNEALEYISDRYCHAIDTYQGILNINASFDLDALKNIPLEKKRRRQEAMSAIKKRFMERSSKGELQWNICIYPTQTLADKAEMSLEDYQNFVYSACGLHETDAIAYWNNLSAFQQKLVDQFNTFSTFRYKTSQFDISFSTKERTWINSNGKRNMPSGEIFSSPVEDSVEGEVYFSYPVLYQGAELHDVRLTVEKGQIIEWSASKGQEMLDSLFQIEGSRQFGEVAVGTNKNIQRATKSILFDEKIGGSIHMAIGASYPEAGGKNISSVHLDMITDMRKDGQIFADNKLIYEKGAFLI